MDRTQTSRWHVPAAVLAVATAGIAAVITATPAVSSQPERAWDCRTEITASGPLVRVCEAPGR